LKNDISVKCWLCSPDSSEKPGVFEGEPFENWRGDQRKPAGIYKSRLKNEDLQRIAGKAATNIKIKKLLPNESSFDI